MNFELKYFLNEQKNINKFKNLYLALIVIIINNKYVFSS